MSIGMRTSWPRNSLLGVIPVDSCGVARYAAKTGAVVRPMRFFDCFAEHRVEGPVETLNCPIARWMISRCPELINLHPFHEFWEQFWFKFGPAVRKDLPWSAEFDKHVDHQGSGDRRCGVVSERYSFGPFREMIDQCKYILVGLWRARMWTGYVNTDAEPWLSNQWGTKMSFLRCWPTMVLRTLTTCLLSFGSILCLLFSFSLPIHTAITVLGPAATI